MIENYLKDTLKHVPYVWDGHGVKAFLSLMDLERQYPEWDSHIWESAIDFIKSDEPKTTRLYHKDFKDLEEITDQTSGRDFGPRYIVNTGIFPLSYWGIWKLYQELGYISLIKSFLDDAVNKLGRLCHETSILTSYLELYPYIENNEELQLYAIERFTEFVGVSFARREETYRDIIIKTEHKDLLKQSLKKPDFFGHNILAFVWNEKGTKYFNQDQINKINSKMEVIFEGGNEWKTPEELLSQRDFEAALKNLILNGPKNVHRYTLANALSFVWNKYPDIEHRTLVSQNVIGFSKSTSPK